MKTAKEILEEVEAGEKLKARGWIQEKCSHCNGTGYLNVGTKECVWCGGTGKRGWKGPITK